MTQLGIVVDVPDEAAGRPPVRTSASGAAGPAAALRAVHVPERRSGERREHQRVPTTDSGTVLPPMTPARMRWNMSAAYTREQAGHTDARRLPQRMWVTPSGASALA